MSQFLGLLFLIASMTANASTVLKLDSPPGDFIGQGKMLTIKNDTQEQAVFQSFGNGAARMSLYAGGDWFLDIKAPNGQNLEVGKNYESATNFPDDMQPELDVGGDGRGCNKTSGWFRLNRVEYGLNDIGENIPNAFSLSFEQSCDGGPALKGELEYAWDRPIIPSPKPLPPWNQTANTLYFNSNEGQIFGDSIGAGLTFMLDDHDGQIVVQPSTNNGYQIFFWSGHNDKDVVEADITFEPPAGERLSIGHYMNAARAGFNGPGTPGLDVGVAFGESSRGCGSVGGSFNVLDIKTDSKGDLKTFAADYVLYCGPQRFFPLRGSVRINSSIPINQYQQPIQLDGPDIVQLTLGIRDLKPQFAIRPLYSQSRSSVADRSFQLL